MDFVDIMLQFFLWHCICIDPIDMSTTFHSSFTDFWVCFACLLSITEQKNYVERNPIQSSNDWELQWIFSIEYLIWLSHSWFKISNNRTKYECALSACINLWWTSRIFTHPKTRLLLPSRYLDNGQLLILSDSLPLLSNIRRQLAQK